MAHKKLGQVVQARQLLQQARREIEQRVPSPNGPELPIEEPPVVWCHVQPVLREAEALIEPAGKAK
jgi:hypothetical protein